MHLVYTVSTAWRHLHLMCVCCRHRPALGECVASFASTFPVAFLEPAMNKFNKNSILFGIEEDMIATHSLEAKGTCDIIAHCSRCHTSLLT